jgi:hypothetical protein
MPRLLPILFAIAVIAIGIVIWMTSAASAAAPLLRGTVGPGQTITLKKSDGTLVRTLKPGTYRIRVNDRSPEHNFHIRGGGVNKKTTVSGTGIQTWTVTFAKGTVTYKCDPHAEDMTRTFKVR